MRSSPPAEILEAQMSTRGLGQTASLLGGGRVCDGATEARDPNVKVVKTEMDGWLFPTMLTLLKLKNKCCNNPETLENIYSLFSGFFFFHNKSTHIRCILFIKP